MCKDTIKNKNTHCKQTVMAQNQRFFAKKGF